MSESAQTAEGLRVTELTKALGDLVEAVSRGDGVGLPEAYRAAQAALTDGTPR